ncbi:structural protein MipA [Campylobacterota bacterium]|nr:structural protein MipA [Campylobacterota bacterium]
MPYFETSTSTRVRVLPFIDLSYGAFFLSPIKGLGVNLSLAENLTVSPAIAYRAARQERDDDSLEGTGDIDADATYGATIVYKIMPVMLSAKIFSGMSDGGTIADFGISVPVRITDEFGLLAGVVTQYADRRYNRTYYGINAQQSANSDYEIYQPSAGLTNVSANLALSYRFRSNTSAMLFTRYKRFIGEAADSPLVKANDDHQYSFGAMIIWSYTR